ncbi:MAG: CHASE3 domain-containing protein, partial [Burkholderiales bacterium]|nr:CHASE3 domain-containing protein [Burkholderiales bacterium]
MIQNWTFGRRLGLGLFIKAVLLTIIGIIGHLSVTQLIDTGEWVTHTHQVLEHIATISSELKDAETGQRGYLLTGEDSYLEPYIAAVDAAPKNLRELRDLTADNSEQQRHLDQVEKLVAAKFAELKRTIDLQRQGQHEQAIKVVGSGEGKRYMDDLRQVLDQMERVERTLLKQRVSDATVTADRARAVILFGTIGLLVFVALLAFYLTRALNSQIGSAVGHVQSSSAELQAAASQQAAGAKEQSGAMTEISTTIGELVATSRQIAESAQRVADIAEQTALAARNGDGTVDKGQESILGIRRQVDQVVEHMLDLGKKSQEIGAVLDIVSELAEQTNILAINATIEATGAGEAGRRFAVVADEIRKLADRVAASTKSIRHQIDEVRGAVNTTVMATESGAKAVDAGARQFSEVASAFKQIASMVVMA